MSACFSLAAVFRTGRPQTEGDLPMLLNFLSITISIGLLVGLIAINQIF